MTQGTVHDSLRMVFQPIVDLGDRAVVAQEALVRGPVGTEFERPLALFDRAAATGGLQQLDVACALLALSAAGEAGQGPGDCLMINLEPQTIHGGIPDELRDGLEATRGRYDVVVEITERALIDDPAGLLRSVDELRKLGVAIALDDLGADRASIALLSLLEPDIIKLDLQLVHHYGTAEIAALADAVRADAERRGAVVLAEGIQTDVHIDRARVIGATHGQGWRFGRPSPKPARTDARPGALWAKLPHLGPAQRRASSPWDLVGSRPDVAIVPKQLLVPMSVHIELAATTTFQPVVLAAFQVARHFQGHTVERFRDLAERCSFVGVLGAGLGTEPLPGVRGGTVAADHPLADEWTVIVLGPHYAGALFARAVDDERFAYLITHQRTVVTDAAHCLMDLITAT